MLFRSEIRELDISRQTLIVMVRREDRLLIPTGSLKLAEGDTILLYTKKMIRDAVEVEV